MRIAIIAPPWLPVPPPMYGGTELVLDELCRALQSEGHDVLLFATGDSTTPVEKGWTFDRAPGVGQLLPAYEMHQAIVGYQTAQAWGADIVHDHTSIGVFYADRHPDLKVVVTNHGPFDPPRADVYRQIAERGVPVVAISKHHASTALGVPITAVIHHGIDPKHYEVGEGDGGYALFLGRMDPEKGVHTAIRVARAAGMPLRLAAKMQAKAEHEYYNDRVKPLIDRGVDVEYLGEVGGDPKMKLIGGATCLLNPVAWSEPFGLVMVEALACGTPVVATPNGAAPEIVEDGVTGFLRSDEESLVFALRHVGGLDRAACRGAVEERFSAERMALDHLALYQEVLAGTL